MNTLNKLLLVAVPVLALSLNANAHDPKMHKKTAEKADCSKMNEMMQDGKMKMDMEDPVMMAMMKKCMDMKDMDMKGMDMKGMDMKGMKDMKSDSVEKPKHAETEHDHN